MNCEAPAMTTALMASVSRSRQPASFASTPNSSPNGTMTSRNGRASRRPSQKARRIDGSGMALSSPVGLVYRAVRGDVQRNAGNARPHDRPRPGRIPPGAAPRPGRPPPPRRRRMIAGVILARTRLK